MMPLLFSLGNAAGGRRGWLAVLPRSPGCREHDFRQYSRVRRGSQATVWFLPKHLGERSSTLTGEHARTRSVSARLESDGQMRRMFVSSGRRGFIEPLEICAIARCPSCGTPRVFGRRMCSAWHL